MQCPLKSREAIWGHFLGFKRNEPDTISSSLLSKLIINLSKLFGCSLQRTGFFLLNQPKLLFKKFLRELISLIVFQY